MNKIKNWLLTTYVIMGYGWKFRIRYSQAKKRVFCSLNRIAA
jgi:hypothetical protein